MRVQLPPRVQTTKDRYYICLFLFQPVSNASGSAQYILRVTQNIPLSYSCLIAVLKIRRGPGIFFVNPFVSLPCLREIEFETTRVDDIFRSNAPLMLNRIVLHHDIICSYIVLMVMIAVLFTFDNLRHFNFCCTVFVLYGCFSYLYR